MLSTLLSILTSQYYYQLVKEERQCAVVEKYAVEIAHIVNTLSTVLGSQLDT